jgi:hypothetical protein
MSFNSAAALPPCRFIPGSVLNGNIPLPFTVAAAGIDTFLRLDFQGFNTFSIYVDISNVSAGAFIATLYVLDPETGLPLDTLTGAELINETADGIYAATLYLPAYYATLTDTIMPFFQNSLILQNTGATDISVDALKLWLSNA